MNLDDEIRQTREKMQADMREAERKRIAAETLENALKRAGMNQSSALVVMPDEDLCPIITETLSRMSFSQPKIVRPMPDGTTRARVTINNSNQNERADQYSFDVALQSNGTGKGSWVRSMWVFRNGSVCFVQNGAQMSWTQMKAEGINPALVRQKIIETIAQSSINRSSSSYSSNSSSSSSSSSGGCYIATAVYGSYDCPEVWVLRRFRDNFLKTHTLGRAFIKVYYAVSPTLVQWFGNKTWFTRFWKQRLDQMVQRLKAKGVSDGAYDDD